MRRLTDAEVVAQITAARGRVFLEELQKALESLNLSVVDVAVAMRPALAFQARLEEDIANVGNRPLEDEMGED